MAITYVGGITGSRTGSTSAGITLSLTSLTGGSNSSPSAGDVVFIFQATGSKADRSMTMSTSGYTEITELYANDSYDTNFAVYYKVMGSTPDTSAVTGPSGSSYDAQTAIAYVWRGVDTTNPLDVSIQTATGTNYGRPTPPAITPSTSGAVILCAGAYALNSYTNFTTGTLSNFLTRTSNDNYDSTLGVGYYAWSSGTYTPAQFGGGSTSTSASWCAATIALKPAEVSSPSPSVSPSRSPSHSVSPSSSPSISPSRSPSNSPSISPSRSPSVSPSISPSLSPSSSISPSPAQLLFCVDLWSALFSQSSPSISPSSSRSPSISPSISPSLSPSSSISPSRSPSISPSVSPSRSPSVSPSTSPSRSPSSSISPSRSPSTSISPSRSPSTSISPSRSPSNSPSNSPSTSPSRSPSSSISPSRSPSTSISPSLSPSSSRSPSSSISPSRSPSHSVSPSRSPSTSISPSRSPSTSISPSRSPSTSISPSRSPSASVSPSIAPVGFKTEWTVAGDATARTITLPLYNSGTFNCTVDWGDGTADSTITSYDDADRIHTYASDGTYQVEIFGSCPAWSFNNGGDKLKITKIVDWGNVQGFDGFSYLYRGFYGCTNLTSLGTGKILALSGLTNLHYTFRDCKMTSIPAGLFDNCINLSTYGFQYTFYNCSSLTSIPTDLFRYNTAVSTYGFTNTFYGCSNLTSIPTDLFRYNTAVSTYGFSGTFYGCSSLTSIPTDLFRYNTAVSTYGFSNTFQDCSNLTSIPTDLFRYNTAVSTFGFSGTFYGCSSLTSIPTDLFRYNTAVSTYGFTNTFFGCSNLTSIPTDLFRYNTAVSDSGFRYTFYGCSNLTSIPTDLFRYNTACTSFSQTFYGCHKLQLNRWIFYASGEENTRFLNQSVDFTSCFNRTSFTGTQGIAPDLWNCSYGTGTPTTTSCFAGAGNSTTSLYNYVCIPSAWGGTAYDATACAAIPYGFTTEWTVAGDATARTITLPLYNSGTFNCTVDWGDGTVDSTINSYDDADRIHTYASDGTYQVEIFGSCPAWSFNNAGDKLKITKIIYWGDPSVFTGFSYLTGGFYGCTNLTSLGTGKILALSGLTTLQNTFCGCSNLTSIPAGLFDNCTNLAGSGFYSTFDSCSSLTSIPTDLFRYNTACTSFYWTFYGCSNLTSIPTDLFRYNTLVSTSGFSYTFYGCSNLTSIPTDLFRYNTLVSTSGFSGTFYGCTNLTSIPTDLFRYNTAVSTSGFYYTFMNCSNLTSIPTDLFRYNTAVSTSGFFSTFLNCSNLTSIPTDLFKYNTAVSTYGFMQTFYGCSNLTSIPTDLFRYNTAVSTYGFYQTFFGCSSLTSIPTDLFRYNTACTAFHYAFYNCQKLQLNKWIFYAPGEESTRFLNQSVNFEGCFYRSSFTGTQGIAPELWNCDFGTGTPTTTSCFGGAGNSTTSLYNYVCIPSAWGGTAYDATACAAIPYGFTTEWTVAGDATARTITLPLYNSGTFNCTVDWGDGTATSTITTYNDADRIHTYASDGTYQVEIFGSCPAWSFNNGGDKLKITKIVDWGNVQGFDGFSYLTGGFSGCTNLTSLGIGKILALSGLTKLEKTFYGCSNLTSIPAGLFDNCTNLGSYGFYLTFGNCSSLTSIPTDLFKYNTAVSTYGFYYTFSGCSGLTSLPTDLFRYNTAVSAYGFTLTFSSCSGLTSLPTDLFKYNTAVSTLGFTQTFNGCINLATVPDGLFKYNTNCTNFDNTFYNCQKLQLNQWIFYSPGEESTRFLNQSVNFGGCFYRTSFTGTQGIAPELWNCDFGTGTPTTGGCFGGVGNSTTSLYNYVCIPSAWGGTAYDATACAALPDLVVGSIAIDRASSFSGGFTILDGNNPASRVGLVTIVRIYANTSLSDCKVGTFYGSGTNWQIRDYENIGNVSSGSVQEFTNLSIDCEIGDVIGIFASSGNIEESSGGSLFYVLGDKFSTGATTYTSFSGTISLEGYIT